MLNKLAGCVIPAYFNIPGVRRPVDHTYVVSDAGERWGCFGRDTGGTEICGDQGMISTALCLSEPDGSCGITYAVNGVCHQAANRILYASGETRVEAAGGYAISMFLFGHYGRLPHPGTSECFGELHSDEEESMEDRGLVPPAAGLKDQDIRLFELRELIIKALDAPLDEESFQKLAETQRVLWLEQDMLRTKLESNLITSQKYLSDLNFSMKKSMREAEHILGRDKFEKIFQDAGDTPEDLINRDTFYEEEKKAGRL